MISVASSHMDDPEEDKAQWTEGRLQEEILKLLPDSTYLVNEIEGNECVVRLVKESLTPEGEKTEETFWEFSHSSKRWALFEAYGYLWLSQQKSFSPLWSPAKPRLTRATVTRYAISKEADPGDLDPDEIAAVYEKTKSQ